MYVCIILKLLQENRVEEDREEERKRGLERGVFRSGQNWAGFLITWVGV